MKEDEKTNPVLTVLPTPKNEKPIEEVPPKLRFGVLVRRGRIRRKLSLREAAQVLIEPPIEGEKDSRAVILGELERGTRPPTEELADVVASTLRMDRDELLQAAKDWHEALWNSDAVLLEGAEFSMASLSPTRKQTEELRDELRRVLVDFEELADALDDRFGDISLLVERATARVNAALEDFDGPKDLPLGEFPDVVLGNTNELNTCKRCEGSGKDPEVEEVEGIRPWELRCQDCDGTGQWIPEFEVGHAYSGRTGVLMYILGTVVTVAYGACLVAETTDSSDLSPVGIDHDATVGWREVPLSVWWKHWLSANPDDEKLQQNLEEAELDENR